METTVDEIKVFQKCNYCQGNGGGYVEKIDYTKYGGIDFVWKVCPRCNGKKEHTWLDLVFSGE